MYERLCAMHVYMYMNVHTFVHLCICICVYFSECICTCIYSYTSGLSCICGYNKKNISCYSTSYENWGVWPYIECSLVFERSLNSI